MDAYALLSSQGWRGKGHSLHKTDDSIGLAKPLLLNRKDNTKGLGTKQHFTSDQWWMNAFDEQLKGLDTSKEGKVVQTITTGKLNALDKGLSAKYSVYATFVRGGFLEGTISMPTPEETESSDTESSKEDDNTPGPSKKSSDTPKKETKEERKARREERRKRKEARALKRAARLERREKRMKKSKSSDSSDSLEVEKQQRRAKKDEKRKRRKE